jgi:3-hydroxyisobutyrate dehydrogenase
MEADQRLRLGWIGVGRMGEAIASRLVAAGHDVTVYNRTRSKSASLAAQGAGVADSIAELADRDIVFTMVAGSADVEQVVCGPEGLLSRPDVAPGMIIDATTISPTVAAEVRAAAEARGVAMLAAPVSGNPKVVASGRLTVVVSGPREAWERAQPVLELFGRGVTYVGEGDRARLVKICHNLMLGVVAQCMAEITVLAEKGGVSRADFLAFLNDSVLGSTFTRYKTPAYVNLDFDPTFTPSLLLKDFQLGLDAGRELAVSMPLAAATQQVVQGLVNICGDDVDFAALLQLAAQSAGLDLVSEATEVDSGLAPFDADLDRVRAASS